MAMYEIQLMEACSQKILLGALLRELWTFSYFRISHSANHNPGAVDEFIFYDVFIGHVHEGL